MLPLAMAQPVLSVRVLLARQHEHATRSACGAAWPRYRLSLALTSWRGEASVELRAASGAVLDRARRPARALPTLGDALGWSLYLGACWWGFRRRRGCAGCGGLRCVCAEGAAREEQLCWLEIVAKR